jgi:hypothetical protein
MLMLAIILFSLLVIALVMMFGWPLAAFAVWAESSHKAKLAREEQAEQERATQAQSALEQRRHEELVAAMSSRSGVKSDLPAFDLD